MDKHLIGKVALITGASSGFGRGAAKAYAERGASVVVAARREELLDELVQSCDGMGVTVLSVPTDVSQMNEIERLRETAMERFGRIDVWINNAGGAVIGAFTEVPLIEHIKVIETDLLGTIYGSYHAMEQFLRQGEGTLINVASMIGKIPAPYYASYSAAKHGVVGLSASLRQELQEMKMNKIRVCTVMPMAMDTSFFEHAANYSGHEGVPIPPLDDAQKVVDVLVDLASNPKDEVPVGNTSGIFAFSDRIMPGLTEALMAKSTHKAQIKDAPPAPPTIGNLRGTSLQGSDVHDPKLNNKRG